MSEWRQRCTHPEPGTAEHVHKYTYGQSEPQSKALKWDSVPRGKTPLSFLSIRIDHVSVVQILKVTKSPANYTEDAHASQTETRLSDPIESDSSST